MVIFNEDALLEMTDFTVQPYCKWPILQSSPIVLWDRSYKRYEKRDGSRDAGTLKMTTFLTQKPYWGLFEGGQKVGQNDPFWGIQFQGGL